MPRPNILYIHSHDTGRFIQPYGHAVPTPHLQALAGGGVLFRQNFCCNPTCSASRAALLTGQYPHQNGMFGLAHRGWGLNDYGKHVLHALRGAGYTSALAGVQHIADDPAKIGYDEILDASHTDGYKAAAAWLGEKRPKPFFLSVGFFETHRPFPEAGPEDDPRYVRPAPTVPDTPETRGDMARFRTMARQLDAKMGAVLEALEASGQAENTLVVCTTDHGIAFPRMKCNLTDHGIGVMLILRGPGGFTGGKAVDRLTSHIDLYPTICEVAGIDAPAWLEGVSLTPLARNPSAAVRDSVFAEVNYHAAYEPMRCVRTERYAYIRRYDERRRPVLPNCDGGPSKDAWLAAGWRENRTLKREEELYDLVFDPQEARNLAGCADYAAVLEEMRGRLDAWQRRTGDPILAGPIPPHPGVLTNDPDGPDASEPPFFRVVESPHA